MTDEFAKRRNMTCATAEKWRPPQFEVPNGWRANFVAALRRYFDLQAGSIWHDVRAGLAQAHGSVLDVGCGAQPYRPLVPGGVTYRGIDTVNAEADFGYSVPDTTYFVGDHWPVADGSVTFVLCTETIEHVFDTRTFLSEAARCLEPGGRLLLTVPFAARWHYIPHDYWRFTPSSLKLLLEEAGFEGVAVYARGNEYTVACYKAGALCLHLLMPQHAGIMTGILLRIIGVLFLPLFIVCTVIANLSLRFRGGDDCLGYTALATKSL